MNDLTPGQHIAFRVVGLQRSGNHAIIEWILAQHSGKTWCFLNNVKHADPDPFNTCAQVRLAGFDPDLGVEQIRRKHRDILVYSYEDALGKIEIQRPMLDVIFNSDLETQLKEVIFDSKHAIDVLIVRDPFNFFASRIKRLETLTGERDLRVIANRWKEIAGEAIKWNTEEHPGRVVANYNRWCADRDYRIGLSRKVLGRFSDSSMNTVSKAGGGSSFDAVNFDRLTLRDLVAKRRKMLDINKYKKLPTYMKRLFFSSGATSMDTSGRWRLMIDDQRYRAVFEDEEIIELSRHLFGDIPGTDEFVSDLR